MRNLEFKARIDDPKALQAKARALGFDLWGDLRQTDTYFSVSGGRLKLRETAGFPAELVFYQRDEDGDFRPSDYKTTPIPDGEALRSMLTAALGVRSVVRKRRTLLLLDTTRMHFANISVVAFSDTPSESRPSYIRLHLDVVEQLGDFVELEVPVNDRNPDELATAQLRHLLDELNLSADMGIRASYADLFTSQS
ncbi:MAG: class IV adenylate cyclase [Dehalococcoidia bacterium]